MYTWIPKSVERRYPSFVNAVTKHNEFTHNFWIYFWSCIDSAEKARAWKFATENGILDPNERDRQRDTEYLKSLEAQISAARRLAKHIERFPDKAAWAFGAALLRLKEDLGSVPLLTLTSEPEGVNRFGYGPGTVPHVMAAMLNYYAEQIEQEPLAKAGPFMHRFQLGPLLFEEAIDKRSARADPSITGLLFELTLFARRYTSQSNIILCSGTKMLRSGRPLSHVAVALIGDTFDVHLSEREAGDRLHQLLKRNPGVSWIGWPDPPERFFGPPRRLGMNFPAMRRE